MIASNELRIGNWVSLKCLVNYVGDDHSPHQINIHNLVSIVENNTEWEFLPIPLTPEILEKCGFYKLNNNWSTNVPDTFKINLYNLNDGNGYLNLIINGANIPCPKINSLHQLQNICFALTGEELIINL